VYDSIVDMHTVERNQHGQKCERESEFWDASHYICVRVCVCDKFYWQGNLFGFPWPLTHTQPFPNSSGAHLLHLFFTQLVWWEKYLVQVQVQVVYYSPLLQTATKLSNSKKAILVCVLVCRHCQYSFSFKKILHMHTDIYESTNYLPKHWPFTARINETTPPHEPLICYEWSGGQTAPHLPVSSLVTS